MHQLRPWIAHGRRGAGRAPWPSWATIVLAYVADGWPIYRSSIALGRAPSAAYRLSRRNPGFAAALAAARVAGEHRRLAACYDTNVRLSLY
jgi:hypothetical protein